MSLRDTLLQLGFVLIAGGAVFATWALLTGPLGRWTRTADPEASEDARRESVDDPRTGSTEEPT